MADTLEGGPGIQPESGNEMVVHAQRLRMGAAIVVVMVVVSIVILTVMIVVMVMIFVRVAASHFDRCRAGLPMVMVGSDDPDIQPGQHAEYHQPCEK